MLGADCTVPNDIDDNRLEWVRQAAVKYAVRQGSVTK
jgi:uroporphyrinogen decarboxylase